MIHYNVIFNSGELDIFDDIRNVRKIMVGDISLPDHIALFCVHEHLVRMSKIRVPIIRKYQSELSHFISKVFLQFTLTNREYWFDFYHRQEMELLESRKDIAIYNRPLRQRKAPERLNITSTKAKSYL